MIQFAQMVGDCCLAALGDDRRSTDPPALFTTGLKKSGLEEHRQSARPHQHQRPKLWSIQSCPLVLDQHIQIQKPSTCFQIQKYFIKVYYKYQFYFYLQKYQNFLFLVILQVCTFGSTLVFYNGIYFYKYQNFIFVEILEVCTSFFILD